MKKLTDDNRLSIQFPELLKEWNYEKNFIKPEEVSCGSGKKAWWKCEKGHEWENAIFNRTRQNKPSGCPYCSGKRVCKENNLLINFPELVKKWSYEKNRINPKEISFGSRKKVWWKCDKKHFYLCSIANKIRGHGCPYCAGKKPSKENNLSLHSASEEFDYEKNFPLTPKDFSLYSGKKVWWLCNKGHSWKAIIANRTKYNYGCRKCSNNISKGEKELYNWCCEVFSFLKIEPNKKGLLENKLFEIDIWFPEINFAIEYNGNYFHSRPKTIKRDKIKHQQIKEENINLFIVWENDFLSNKEQIKKQIGKRINERMGKKLE